MNSAYMMAAVSLIPAGRSRQAVEQHACTGGTGAVTWYTAQGKTSLLSHLALLRQTLLSNSFMCPFVGADALLRLLCLNLPLLPAEHAGLCRTCFFIYDQLVSGLQQYRPADNVAQHSF